MFIRTLMLFVLVGCGAPQHAQYPSLWPGDYTGCDFVVRSERIKTFDIEDSKSFHSGNYSELVSCLPSTFPHRYLFLPVYKVKLKNLKAGDVIVLAVEMEVTNEYNFEFMVGSFITLGEVEIAEAQGYNVTPGMHHGTVNRTVIYNVPVDIEEVDLTFWSYSADGSTILPSFLIVEQDYGSLSGVVLRN